MVHRVFASDATRGIAVKASTHGKRKRVTNKIADGNGLISVRMTETAIKIWLPQVWHKRLSRGGSTAKNLQIDSDILTKIGPVEWVAARSPGGQRRVGRNLNLGCGFHYLTRNFSGQAGARRGAGSWSPRGRLLAEAHS